MSIPARVAQYRVIRLLGEGGMGAVYEAIDDGVERRVAIKVLQPQYAANQNVVARFFNEARAVNRIDHPSTVKIFESSHLPDGTAYLVMELLKGESLASRLRREKHLPVTVIADIGWQIATALEAAHENKIVHRDLKPDNLMLVADPVAARGERVKVLDFGIAKLVEGVPHPTKSNVIMGTPTYMSPEQCKGAGSVDGRSDVYSLGVILFEMLAGRPPFIGEGPGEVIGMHLFTDPPDLATVAPQTPPGFTQLVNRLLLKDRAKRPTLQETINTLAGLRDNRAAAPTVVQIPAVVATHHARRWWAALLAVTTVLALIGSYVVNRLRQEGHAVTSPKPMAGPVFVEPTSSTAAQPLKETSPPPAVAPPPPPPEPRPFVAATVAPSLPASTISASAPSAIKTPEPRPTPTALSEKPKAPSQVAAPTTAARSSPPTPKLPDTKAIATTSPQMTTGSRAVAVPPSSSKSQGGPSHSLLGEELLDITTRAPQPAAPKPPVPVAPAIPASEPKQTPERDSAPRIPWQLPKPPPLEESRNPFAK